MKKVLVLLSIILTTAFSYAAKNGESVNARLVKAKSGYSFGIKNINGTLKFSHPAGCTVTITASLGYSSTYIQASCSSTQKTCDLAIAEASGCVRKALDAAKQNIK